MVAAVTATVHSDVAAVAVVVTGWVTSQAVTGSVPYGPGGFFPATYGTNGHVIDLPYGADSLRIALDGVNSGGNDLDLYLYRDTPAPPEEIASGVTASADETLSLGELPAARYTAWVHGFGAVPVTGAPYTLTVSGIDVTGQGTPVHVFRVAVDLDGNAVEEEVLGSPVVPSGGTLVAWDTVAPLDTSVYYRVRDSLALTGATPVQITSNTVSVTGQGVGWLKDPAQPVNDIHLTADCLAETGGCPTGSGVTFQALDDADFASANGVFPIVDTARSRVVAQARKARESVLHLLTHRHADTHTVEVVLRSGRTLLLQLDDVYGWAYDTWNTDYVDVGDAREARITSVAMRRTQRLWTLPIALTGPPAVTAGLVAGNGVGVNGATYGDATASGRTYAQRTATGNAFADTSLGVGL